MNGARAFTASSGPGVSLMQEFLGLAYFSEVPVVLFDIQRVIHQQDAYSNATRRPSYMCNIVSRRYETDSTISINPERMF